MHTGYALMVLIMYLRPAMDLISSILIFLFWIFIVNVATRFFKKMFGAENQTDKKQKPAQNTPETEMPSPEEVFRELRKKMEEARRERSRPVSEGKRQTTADRKNQDAPEKQEVYRRQETISEKEMHSSEEFQRALMAARKREHDASASKLAQPDQLGAVEQEALPEFELDLRNAMIGSVILERPYS